VSVKLGEVQPDPIFPCELNVPKAQRRRPAPPLTDIANQHPDRDAAIAAAYATGAYTHREIASFFGLHPGSVGRIVRHRM
jgi:putative transposase